MLNTQQAIRGLLDLYVWQEFVVIELTASLIQQAEDLLDKYPLRAFDSVQLASALVAKSELIRTGQPPPIFVSADSRLLAVVSAEGLTVDDPNVHP